MKVTQENGIPTVTADFHEMEEVARIVGLTLAQHAPPATHEFTSSTEEDRVLGFCSCFGWSCESDGATSQSKAWVKNLHAAHVRRETA